MKNHKLKIILPILLISIFSVGCSNNNVESKKEESVSIDVQFTKDIEQATKKRWDLVDKQTEKEKNPDYTETAEDAAKHYEDLVEAEFSLLSKYDNANFQDAKLKALATQYINGVKLQKEAVPFYTVDSEKFWKKWNEGYNERCVSLLELTEQYGVVLDENTYKDLRLNAQLINERTEIDKKVKEMVSNINFELTKNSYGWKTYSCVVENTAGVVFDGFELEIDLLDKDDVVVGTQNVYHYNQWKENQKIRLEFDTDVKFEKLEWRETYYIAEQ